jgi:FtsP/CotA-like multicopper oxidase with cupredoxin domain
MLLARSTSGHKIKDASSPPVPVVTPDLADLPFTMDGDVKVFRLIAEPVRRELVGGRFLQAWGYNGSTPGPTIQTSNGDRVRIVVENRLPESTTMHWHGLEIPIEMDGAPYLSQKPIRPGESYTYEFTLKQEGTFFYHSHGAMQEMMGLMGMFIIHPRQAWAPRVDHDFAIFLQEWALLPGATVPDSTNMEFNWLTFNGKVAPATTPLVVPLNSRVRIRLANIGMDHHPIHLHGHTFYVTGTEAGRQPETLWGPANTVLVGVAQARDIEFVANNPGDWMIHCHLPHHMMNAMMDLSSERRFANSPLTPEQAAQQMKLMMPEMPMPESSHPAPPQGAPTQTSAETPAETWMPAVAARANAVAGFPQDAFMEMHMHGKNPAPETSGLPENWASAMSGMMTLLRVLPRDKYDEIMKKKRSGLPAAEAHQ